jgi:hypothetical protein
MFSVDSLRLQDAGSRTNSGEELEYGASDTSMRDSMTAFQHVLRFTPAKFSVHLSFASLTHDMTTTTTLTLSTQ